MRRTIHRVDEMPLEASPITKKGEVVLSTIHEISDLDDPTIKYIETYTPGKEESIKVLRFLNEMNGIGWTPQLIRIEKELRAALMDLWSSDVS